eukprot:1950337-Rhodomonas_salina.1
MHALLSVPGYWYPGTCVLPGKKRVATTSTGTNRRKTKSKSNSNHRLTSLVPEYPGTRVALLFRVLEGRKCAGGRMPSPKYF